MTYPPCTKADPQLFDSTKPRDHARARAVCSTCPRVRECLELAGAISGRHQHNAMRRGPDGTWGGRLWRNGEVVPA